MARELAALSDEARFKSVVEDVDIDVDSIRQDDVGGRRDTASRDTVRAAGSADSPASSAVPADQVSSPAEMVSSTWAWPPVLAILVPAVGLIITLVAR